MSWAYITILRVEVYIIAIIRYTLGLIFQEKKKDTDFSRKKLLIEAIYCLNSNDPLIHSNFISISIKKEKVID